MAERIRTGRQEEQTLTLAGIQMRDNSTFAASCYLPGHPPLPCPELLTEAEAIRYLRLDTVAIDHPSETLRRYREKGLLRGTQVSKRIFYRRVELDRLLERLTDENPR